MSGALLDHLWQSTLFGGAAWLLTLALRRNSAAIRHALWAAASLKFLVPFSVLYRMGAAAGLPAPVAPAPFFSAARIATATPLTSPSLALGAVGGVQSALSTLLLWVWLGGLSWLALRWLRDWRTAARLADEARPLPGALQELRLTEAAVEPAVARVFRPVVLLPAALLAQLPRAQFDAVIAHEREHIARRDNLLAHLQRLVETLFWFHPMVWFIGRALREERELACDESVVAAGHEPAEYAAGILTVCRHCATAHSAHAIAALSGDLTRRVANILRAVPPRSLGALKSCALLLCAFAVAAVPLAAGALDGDARRQRALEHNSHLLADARYEVSPAAAPRGSVRVRAAGREVIIDDTSLRELIALAYGVNRYSVGGTDPWLDAARYHIRAEADGAVADPDELDPTALRGLVNKLLGARFDLEVYVNQRCQDPCGRRGLVAPDAVP